MTARTLWSGLLASVTAVTLGLATGAAWMLVALPMDMHAPWLALLVGAVLGWTLRWSVRRPPLQRAMLAVLATTAAALWVSTAFAGVLIGGSMGMGLAESLRAAGPGMLWQLVRLGTSASEVLWNLAGIALAAWIAGRAIRR